MKTSNKILLSLLVIVFTVPFLLATSLKTKMQKGDYTVKKKEGKWKQENLRSGSFTAFKSVKIIAPAPQLLTCRLTQSNDLSYKYYNSDAKDSVAVFTSNDTLYVQYISEKKIKDEDGMEDYNNLSIDIRLPAFSNITVDGAVVVMSMEKASLENLSVTLRNEGVIKDSGKNTEEETAAVHVKKDEVVATHTSYTAEVVPGGSFNVKTEILKNIKMEMPDLNLRDGLLYLLLRRI